MDAPAAATKPKRKLIIARIVIWGLVVLAVVWYFAARSGKSVWSAIAGPTTLTDERVQLLIEGEWKAYSFSLPAARKIEVHIGASPKAVDVVTVAKEQYDRFAKAHKAPFGGEGLFGGEYRYIPALSSERVTKYDGDAILAQGEWYVIVMRPQLLVANQLAKLGGGPNEPGTLRGTNAQIKILAY